MKHLTQLTLTALAAISLPACGGSGDMDHSTMDDSKMDHSTMDHSQMDDTKTMGDIGHTTGVVVSISPDGSEATIDHKAINGVGMGAMTMEFTVMSSIDVSPYAADQNVSFMVKKGRDGSYRITAMCNTDAEGADCLKAMMDHSGH